MWHVPMGQPGVLAVGCHTFMNSAPRWKPGSSAASLPCLGSVLCCCDLKNTLTKAM